MEFLEPLKNSGYFYILYFKKYTIKIFTIKLLVKIAIHARIYTKSSTFYIRKIFIFPSFTSISY